MKKNIKINTKNFEYTLKRRRGARCVRLSICPDGGFVVTAPRWYPFRGIREFIEEKSDWIFEKLKNVDFGELSRKKEEENIRYKRSREEARRAIQARVEFLNRHYGFSYNRLSVKNQKTCWGSASAKRNLNFNHKIAWMPEKLRDYIIVHELCHLKELNHSERFWELVGETMPEYREIRKELRKIRI